MGGFGSGRRRVKTPVEDCRVLDAGALQRAKWLRKDFHARGPWAWYDSATGEKTSRVECEVNTKEAAPWLRLQYRFNRTEEDVDYLVRLAMAPLPWGRDRWSFLCPAVGCGRACRKLYLPPGGRYFACRLCYRLTYRSAQKAHKLDGIFRELAAAVGMSPEQVKRLLA
jgi:hypothetical protein